MSRNKTGTVGASTLNTHEYEIAILVQVFPGKSIWHGPLRRSTIALLRVITYVARIVVGRFGIRNILMKCLEAIGLAPADVTNVLLSDCHHEHALNWPIFKDADLHLLA